MIDTNFQLYQAKVNSNIMFRGKSETFLKLYNSKIGNIPLKDTISKTINDESCFLGEGLSKKVYDLQNLKGYIVRIYKKFFTPEDLNTEFVKPKKNHINMIDDVVLHIPNKIDIAKKRDGQSIGVADYSKRISADEFPPLSNVYVTREETLHALDTYEQIKNFPLESFKHAYRQIKKFCSEPGYQFDVISPNNILVDTVSKKINIIDPLEPKVNNGVHGEVLDFSLFHGCDSLYPVLCDFLMQSEHLANLNKEEQLRWKKSIFKIIIKCIEAGKAVGYERNVDKLDNLYARIDKFWTSDRVRTRYNNFVDLYSGVINSSKTIETALNHKNSEEIRINAIKHLDSDDFNKLKPVFEKILEAPHQVKVEIPEILNAAVDKISEYGKSAKSVLPDLEILFDKEIFCTTKKRLYQLFIQLQPENKRFLSELQKSSINPFEKTLYKQEFEMIHNIADKLNPKSKQLVNNIYQNSISGEIIPQNIADKLWISRTCTNSGPEQNISLNNMAKAYNYLEKVKHRIPGSSDLIKLHKIILADTPGQEDIAGLLRTPETDERLRKVFKITKSLEGTVNPYSDSKDTLNDLKKLDKYIKDNYDKIDTFQMAANLFFEVTRIHPFLNGNGRSTRLFVEQYLLSKGYRLQKWPEEILYRKIYSPEQIAEKLKSCSTNA